MVLLLLLLLLLLFPSPGPVLVHARERYRDFDFNASRINYEAFKIRPHRGKFLTLDRRTSHRCEPANQFVLQPVDKSQSLFCVYSPIHGLFISSHSRPQVSGWGVCCYDFLVLPSTPYYS